MSKHAKMGGSKTSAGLLGKLAQTCVGPLRGLADSDEEGALKNVNMTIKF